MMEQSPGQQIYINSYLNPNQIESHCLDHSFQRNDYPTFHEYLEKNYLSPL